MADDPSGSEVAPNEFEAQQKGLSSAEGDMPLPVNGGLGDLSDCDIQHTTNPDEGPQEGSSVAPPSSEGGPENAGVSEANGSHASEPDEPRDLNGPEAGSGEAEPWSALESELEELNEMTQETPAAEAIDEVAMGETLHNLGDSEEGTPDHSDSVQAAEEPISSVTAPEPGEQNGPGDMSEPPGDQPPVSESTTNEPIVSELTAYETSTSVPTSSEQDMSENPEDETSKSVLESGMSEPKENEGEESEAMADDPEQSETTGKESEISESMEVEPNASETTKNDAMEVEPNASETTKNDAMEVEPDASETTKNDAMEDEPDVSETTKNDAMEVEPDASETTKNDGQVSETVTDECEIEPTRSGTEPEVPGVSGDDSQPEGEVSARSGDHGAPMDVGTDDSMPVITSVMSESSTKTNDISTEGAQADSSESSQTAAAATDSAAPRAAGSGETSSSVPVAPEPTADREAANISDGEGDYQTDLPEDDDGQSTERSKAKVTSSTSSSSPKSKAAVETGKEASAGVSKSTHSGSNKASGGEEGKAKTQQACIVCKKVGKCKYNIMRNGDIKHLCDENCFKVFRAQPTMYLRKEGDKAGEGAPTPPNNCANCFTTLPSGQSPLTSKSQGVVKAFCRKPCQDTYLKEAKKCASCKKNVKFVGSAIMVMRDKSMRDFCNEACNKAFVLDDDEILIVGTSKVSKPAAAPKPTTSNSTPVTTTSGTTVTAAGRRTRAASGLATCAVCHKMSSVKHEVTYDEKLHKLCSDTCFSAFRNANRLAMNMCETCGTYVYEAGLKPQNLQFEGAVKKFCSVNCVAAFKKTKARIVSCAWCHIRKPNFDMVERLDVNGKVQLFCTLNCLSLFRVNLQATSNISVPCDQCRKTAPAQYHLTMSDASVRNFCSYGCVMGFQSQFTSPGQKQTPTAGRTQPTTPTQQPQTGTRAQARQTNRVVVNQTAAGLTSIIPNPAAVGQQQQAPAGNKNVATRAGQANVPVISNVMSLASPGQSPPANQLNTRRASRLAAAATPPQQAPRQAAPSPSTQVTTGTSTSQQVIVQHPPPKDVRNRSLLCKPIVQTKATSCRPHTQSKETQTDDNMGKQVLVPIPVPIYVPVPMVMYNNPVPYPLPIPIPVPIPAFIPTTKKTTSKVAKFIQEILDKTPADPFEAELLLMAESLANAEKAHSDSSDDEDNDSGGNQENINPSQTDTKSIGNEVYNKGDSMVQNNGGEDMLEMALRIAQEMRDEPAMDLEESITSTPINPADAPPITMTQQNDPDYHPCDSDDSTGTPPLRGRGRGRGRGRPRGGGGLNRNKRIKLEDGIQSSTDNAVVPPAGVPADSSQPPDANMVLKYTYGVNAWKHWVVGKNAQLEQASAGRRLKKFKTDILTCSADELNYSLCLFVKEVRKPNGEEYAPDSIYYLCLGIQQYIYENGRIDNIFTDSIFDKFTGALHEVLQRYEVRLNLNGLIVCRIEEEHLWESKQLGAHSPCVLLNTLMYFNTKFFMLHTAIDHQNLSFSHIMKHWKKSNTPGTKTPGRSVYLRYYAPAAEHKPSTPGIKRKREENPIYEQCENAANPLRCPVKLYEFYLSKCPESIKNRNDVFYLTPESSCVPDSPVWYSTLKLDIPSLQKMLTRTDVVREIQEARLHQQPMFM